MRKNSLNVQTHQNGSGEENSFDTIESQIVDTKVIFPTNWVKNEKHKKNEVAAKNDDAEVPVHLWDNALSVDLNRPVTLEMMRSLKVLRHAVCQVWKRRVTRCFCSWLRCRKCHGKQLKQKHKQEKEEVYDVCKTCGSVKTNSPRAF